MYSNNIVNSQESTTIVNAGTKKSGNLSYAPPNYLFAQGKIVSSIPNVNNPILYRSFVYTELNGFLHSYYE